VTAIKKTIINIISVTATKKTIINIISVTATKKTIIIITGVIAMKKEISVTNVVGINIDMITNGVDGVETGKKEFKSFQDFQIVD
jgi:hypothetical protein